MTRRPISSAGKIKIYEPQQARQRHLGGGDFPTPSPRTPIPAVGRRDTRSAYTTAFRLRWTCYACGMVKLKSKTHAAKNGKPKYQPLPDLPPEEFEALKADIARKRSAIPGGPG